MEYLIDGTMTTERHFWNCLHGLASQPQLQRILDGYAVNVGGIIYQIINKEGAVSG